jgi:hypothetical protein
VRIGSAGIRGSEAVELGPDREVAGLFSARSCVYGLGALPLGGFLHRQSAPTLGSG